MLIYVFKSPFALITVFLSNSTKFRGNVDISRQQVNSLAWLKIPWPAENWGPYSLPYQHFITIFMGMMVFMMPNQ